jgi:alginate O-acetyltransferase complex protein AlgI
LFYYWGEGVYLSILLIYVIINYTFGILIERNINNYKLINSKIIVITGIILNILILLYYKYYFFIINIFTNNQNIGIHLPIGISFYTFQSISYLIDVSRRDVNAEENPEARKFGGVTNLPYFVVVKDGQLVAADTTAKEEGVEKMIGLLN